MAEPAARVDVPRVVAPEVKVITPVGVTVPDTPATFAVKVAGLPRAGAAGKASVVVVAINAGLPAPPQPRLKSRVQDATRVRAISERRRRDGMKKHSRLASVPAKPMPSSFL